MLLFYGPFLPIVPFLILLENLPEAIGEPIQAVIIGGAYKLVEGLSGIISFIF